MNERVAFGWTERSDVSGADDRWAAAFLVLVGERVRTARTRKGLSRKILSQRSGVSQRYLAQLEGGDGNMSIALLRRVAVALDHNIEWLVAADDPWTSDLANVTSLYRSATAEQRAKVLAILEPGHPAARRARRVALIGLRGAGKSTLGRAAAAALDVPFMELNQEIEAASGMPVHEVIALYGQEGYRRLEHQSVERIAATNDVLVLAVAGGIVSEPETFAFLLRHYHTIWLKAAPEDHMSRVRAQGDLRPMAGHPAAMDELKATLASREPLYSRAEGVVQTSARTEEDALTAVLALLRSDRFLGS